MSVTVYLWSTLLVSVTVTVLVGVITVLFIAYSCSRTMASNSAGKEETYVRCLQSLLSTGNLAPRSSPSQVLNFLCVGGASDARDVQRLAELGVTHVVNCASSYIRTGEAYYGKKMRYMEIDAEDELDYDIISHYDNVRQFIEEARTSGGKALVHCIMGINRSVALVVAYMMTHENTGPITAARKVVNARCCVLTNASFQRQLIHFAAERNLLELDERLLADYNSNI